MSYRSHTCNLRLYFLIVLICGLSALLMELFSQGTSRFQSYAEQRLDDAVRKAVESGIQELASHSSQRETFVKSKE